MSMIPSPQRIWKRLRSLPVYGMKAGVNVRVERPHRVTSPHCIHVGDRTRIYRNAQIFPVQQYAGVYYTPEVRIGSDVYIGPDLSLICTSKVSIGSGCTLAASVFITDNNHGFDPQGGLIIEQQLVQGGEVNIGEHCFIGLRVAILPGVTLGDHCIVGTNSVVTKSFPAYSMIGGVPAKLIRSYNFETGSWAQ